MNKNLLLQVRSIITDVRKSVTDISIDQQTILQEVSMMPPTPWWADIKNKIQLHYDSETYSLTGEGVSIARNGSC